MNSRTIQVRHLLIISLVLSVFNSSFNSSASSPSKDPNAGSVLRTKRVISAIHYTGRASAALLVGNYLYLNRIGTGVQVVQVNRYNQLIPIDTLFAENQEYISNMAFAGGLLYTHRGYGFGAVDISDPEHPRWIENNMYMSQPLVYGVAVGGEYVYTSCVDFVEPQIDHLLITDFADPATPEIASTVAGTGGRQFVSYLESGGASYVVLSGSIMDVYNVTDPFTPSIVATYTTAPYKQVAGDGIIATISGTPEDARTVQVWTIDANGYLDPVAWTNHDAYSDLVMHDDLLAAALPDRIVFYRIPALGQLEECASLPVDETTHLVAIDNQRLVFSDSDSLYVLNVERFLNAPRADPGLVKEFSLAGIYPNPFNESTTLEFELPSREIVRIVLYNVMGRQVWSSVYRPGTAGLHRVPIHPEGLASGIYFIRAQAGSRVATRKLVLLK